MIPFDNSRPAETQNPTPQPLQAEAYPVPDFSETTILPAEAVHETSLRPQAHPPIVLYEDTRQQAGKHKNIALYCQRHGIEIIRQALNVGDYQIAGRGAIAVDTKMSVLELAGNIFQDHARFRDECQRAQRCGIQLIILIEENLPEGRLDLWRPPMGKDGRPMTRFNPKTLRQAMLTMQEKYGVKFRFCDGRSTGRTLIDYLTGIRE